MVLQSKVYAEALPAVVSTESMQSSTAAARKEAGSAADGSGEGAAAPISMVQLVPGSSLGGLQVSGRVSHAVMLH